MKKNLLVIFLTLVLVAGLAAQELNVASWKADIEQYRKTISQKHKNPFTRISKTDFNTACDELLAALPGLKENEAHVGLCRIAARIGDAHTTVELRPEHLFPLSIYWFSEGLRVVAIDKGHEDLLGAGILYVNGVPIEQVVAMISTIIPHENEAQLKLQVPNYLVNAEALFGLGIINNKEECSYTFDIASRAEPEVVVKAVALADIKTYMSANMVKTVPEKEMLATKYLDRIYWYEVLEEQNAVYVMYRSCREMDGYSFKKFVSDVMEQVDVMDNPKLIIDLRSNGGGNSNIFAPMTQAVKDRPALNQKDKLFLLVGRKTFSSAILNAMDMRNETSATLVGEPTGGKPNHFGEVKNDQLKNSGIRFTWSVKYFKMTDDDPDTIVPDVIVDMSYADLKSGVDVGLSGFDLGCSNNL